MMKCWTGCFSVYKTHVVHDDALMKDMIAAWSAFVVFVYKFS
jgi:hypothetical protein